MYLVGRKEECTTVERLVEAARAARSSVVVIEAEPGMGKTSMLDHVADLSGGFTVLRTEGIESEFDLSYGALSRLLHPVQHLVEGLDPAPGSLLSELLRPSRFFDDGHVVDRFTVGVALLAAAAETTPVAVLVDDVQWIDESSIDALAFCIYRKLDVSSRSELARRLQQAAR